MAIGDDDPEDGYDAGDPPIVRLRNIAHRLAYVRDRLELRARDGHPTGQPEDQRRILTVIADLSTALADLPIEP
jgi:hypothetical protein